MARKALLLAAGLGTRLRPLTDIVPKCMAPVHGRPLLEYWLRALDDAGFEQILINTHHHAGLVREYAAACPWSRKITLVHEDRLLGTGGTLVANASFFDSQPALVAHADNLSLFDAEEFYSAHQTRPAAARLTMMTFTTDDPSSCGIVSTNAAGLVDGFFEKVSSPPGNRANAAVYVFEPATIELAVGLRNAGLDISTQLIPLLLGKIWPWHNSVYHRDIGTLSSWRAAQRDFPGAGATPAATEAWRLTMEKLSPAERATIDELLAPA